MDDQLKNMIEGIFGGINSDVSSIMGQITMSPVQAFGDDFWNSLLKIGASVIMPFAITLLCFAMASELYNVYCKANGELDLELVSTTFVKFILPFICITKTYDLLQILFKAFNGMITQIGNALGAGTAGQLTDTAALINQIQSMDFFGKFGLMMELFPLSMGMKLMSLVITVIVYGRMIEIVIYWIFAPIPLAALTNSDFGDMGKNFIKMFAAVLLQGGFMMICVAIYSLLIKQHVFEPSVNGGWVLLAYSAVLIFTLSKSGSMAKRILGTF